MICNRDYQTEALKGIHEQFANYDSTLLSMATGLGKTITFAQVARDYMKHGRVVVLAHREELISQAHQKLFLVCGIEPDIEMGEYRTHDFDAFRSRLMVSTVQTQIAGNRMGKFKPHDYSLLVIDEAHHACAKSYRRVIDYYRQNPNLKVLGVTATPDRADEEALGQIFESVAFEYGIKEGINDGWLVPIEQQSVYVEGLDYSSVRTTAGDLNGADLARILEFEENLHRVANPTVELCGDKKTLVFAASLAQAERLTEIFERYKPGSARWVHGKTPKDERKQLFADYAAKKFQFLVNVGVATEGFDDPGIEIVVMARPTKSRSLYAQMAGRGTRPLPGVVDNLETAEERVSAIAASDKSSIMIIDFVGNSGRHTLITSADVLGGNYSDEIVERAKKNAEAKSVENKLPVDVLDELEIAERELERERQFAAEAARRSQLKINALYSTAAVNPFDRFGITPRREVAWHRGRIPSEKQIEFLARRGIDASGLSFTHASQLIEHTKNLCTEKQANVLKRFGYDTAKMKFNEASVLISQLAENGWKKVAM